PALGFGYATSLVSGGVTGNAKAGSIPCWPPLWWPGRPGNCRISQDPKDISASLATSLTLAGIMGMRFYHFGKFISAGFNANANLLMFGIPGLKIVIKPQQV
uniref:Transmembrane protein 14C n=1 Tax=Vombatus ursinus TaxID=29139 RepID=A0A4X2KE07_VOMUR